MIFLLISDDSSQTTKYDLATARIPAPANKVTPNYLNSGMEYMITITAVSKIIEFSAFLRK